VDAQGLVHVDNHKVVVPRLGAGEFGGVELGRLLLDAQHGGDVSLLVGGRDVTPGSARESVVVLSLGVLAQPPAYHSRRTLSLSLVHVVDVAILASKLARPLFWRSSTASADTRLTSSSQGTASSPTRVRRAMMAASLCAVGGRTCLSERRGEISPKEMPHYYTRTARG